MGICTLNITEGEKFIYNLVSIHPYYSMPYRSSDHISGEKLVEGTLETALQSQFSVTTSFLVFMVASQGQQEETEPPRGESSKCIHVCLSPWPEVVHSAVLPWGSL